MRRKWWRKGIKNPSKNRETVHANTRGSEMGQPNFFVRKHNVDRASTEFAKTLPSEMVTTHFFPKDVSSQGSSEDCLRMSHHAYQ